MDQVTFRRRTMGVVAGADRHRVPTCPEIIGPENGIFQVSIAGSAQDSRAKESAWQLGGFVPLAYLGVAVSRR